MMISVVLLRIYKLFPESVVPAVGPPPTFFPRSDVDIVAVFFTTWEENIAALPRV